MHMTKYVKYEGARPAAFGQCCHGWSTSTSSSLLLDFLLAGKQFSEKCCKLVEIYKMFLCHPRQRIRCCKLLRKFSALWKMSDRGDEAVNVFSNWLTIPCKMSHTRRPVLKWSQNTWKSGANTNTASFCNSYFSAFVFCHIVIFGLKFTLIAWIMLDH